VTIEGECKGWLPEKSQPDNRKCIFFWDGKVIEPGKAPTGKSTTVGGTTEDGLRHLSRWVLSVGGEVRIKYEVENAMRETWVNRDDKLPDHWFTISAVSLSGSKEVHDDDLGLLLGPAELTLVRLEYLPISDAGLAKVAQMKRLTDVYLKKSWVGDGAIPHLAKLPNLTTLDLSNTKLTEAGLKHLDELGRVTTLALQGLPVTDAVMPRLAELSCLADLDLTGTKVTDAGVRHLAKLDR